MGVQLPIPEFETPVSPAEGAFVSLSRYWRTEFLRRGRVQTPESAEVSLAALLVSNEFGATFSYVARREAQENISASETALAPWMCELPWRLSIAVMEGSSDLQPLSILVGNLNHPTSYVRVRMMELAWAVRASLPRDESVSRLLENVATTLIGVETAWGLVGALFAEEDELLRVALAFSPSDLSDQYIERLSLLRQQGLKKSQVELWSLEARCRRLIADALVSSMSSPRS